MVRKPSADEPTSAFVFKTIADPYAGRISLFRVMTGVLKSDTTYFNSTRDTQERVGPLSLLQGKHTESASELNAGDLGAVTKLKETHTGDTLCDKSSPILYDTLKSPDPVISFAIEPKSRGDEEKISQALQRLGGRRPDSTLRARLENGRVDSIRNRPASYRSGRGSAKKEVRRRSGAPSAAGPLPGDDYRYRGSPRPSQKTDRRTRSIR